MRWRSSACAATQSACRRRSPAASCNDWFSRALAGSPAALLADEPTGNLDSKNGDAVMELLHELHRGGATIIMVTHDPRFARHAQRTVHMFDGKVVGEPMAMA